MPHEKLDAIRDAAHVAFHKLFSEAIPEIETAMVAAADDAQANETEAKLNIGFAVKLNLDKNAVQYRLAFSVAHKFDACEPMPDPNQQSLDLPEGEEEFSEEVVAEIVKVKQG